MKGLVVGGSTGEFASLSTNERIDLLASVQKNAMNMENIAGTGCVSANNTIELTNIAADLGYTAAMVITPYYYHCKMNETSLVEYYQSVADSSTIPIILYNMRANTGYDILPSTVRVLAKHENIIGIKSSGNIGDALQYVNHTRDDDFSVIVGSGSLIKKGFDIGCTAAIVGAANYIPDSCHELWEAYIKDPDGDNTEKLQKYVGEINDLVTSKLGVSGIKYAMDCMGMSFGGCRLPLIDLDRIEKRLVSNIINRYGLVNKLENI
eukprot:TRINITY_DN3654_c0_g1_i2.p1 TRINITY_DN3654_c0_g1~~TRINITY_DN3654_c0_g1_i2.p1  ORF type:complete len:265 (+),score=60.09 TRINITY_DN3654_c0_g1_i2:366-1160(+)